MRGVRGIVLDMEGVLHVDWSPIAGSAAAVAELAARGIELGVLTNTTGKTRAAIAERLAGIGYELLRLAHPDLLPSVLLWES